MLPSVQPFSARPNGLVAPGNPTNDDIYTIPGPYLTSAQHPASIYRLHVHFETAGSDDAGVIALGATQMRPGSERIAIDGRPLVRDLDYKIDYDLARVELLRPDTLLTRERTVEVGYEENQEFAASPTTLAGFVSELPVSHGVLNFTAINQSQTNAFTRPQLGFQGNSMMTAGMSGQFSWNAPFLTQLASHLPFGSTNAASHIGFQAEVATSHPQFATRQGDAYVETFDAGAGTSFALSDLAWYYSSLPAYGNTLRSTFGGSVLEPNRAATLTWQSNISSLGGHQVTFTRTQIDPLTHLVGTGFQFNEPILWLDLLPLDQVGRYNRSTRSSDWTVGNPLSGRRFRSIRTVLNPAGLDLTTGELLQFWTLLDTSITARAANPTLVFDFGDVSENSLSFGPETLTVRRNADGTVDSLFTGKKLQGFDSLDTERDPFSHAFNADVNDTGLPGDVVDTLVVIDGTSVTRITKFRLCRNTPGAIEALGDPVTDCTIGNRKLDEEDIDQDNAMNFKNAQRENERLLRYVVDLSDASKYKRVGGTYTDTVRAARRAAHPHAALGAGERSVQDADRFAQRRRPPATACAAHHDGFGRRGGRRRRAADRSAARRAHGDGRAVARPEQPDACRRCRHSSGRRLRHDVDDRHDRLQRGRRLPAAARRRRRSRYPQRAVFGNTHADQRKLAAVAGGRAAALPPRGVVLPLSVGAAGVPRLPAAARVGTRARERLGTDRRSADVHQARARREQLLHVSHARQRRRDGGGVERLHRRLQPLHRAAEPDRAGISVRQDAVDRVHGDRFGDRGRVAVARGRRGAPFRRLRRRLHGLHARPRGHGAESGRGAGDGRRHGAGERDRRRQRDSPGRHARAVGRRHPIEPPEQRGRLRREHGAEHATSRTSWTCA